MSLSCSENNPRDTTGGRREASTDVLLLTAFAALCLPPVLLVLRFLDDNTLTSWRWIFAPRSLPLYCVVLIASVLGSWHLSRFRPVRDWYPWILFTCAFLSVLPLWTEPEAVLDAGRYFLQAKWLEQQGALFFLREWGGQIPAWTDLPLVPFLYGVLFRLAGEFRHLIQLFTTTLFSLAAVFTWLIGKRLWDSETGFLAGMLLLASPYLLVQVPLMLVDVPVLFLIVFALWSFLAAVDRGGIIRLMTASLALALALLSKYSAGPMLLVLPVAAFVLHRRGGRKVLRRSALIAAAACAPILLLVLWKHDLVWRQIELLRTYQWTGLERWKESVTSTFFFQVHPFVTAAAACGAWYALRGRDDRFLVPAWFVLFALLFRADRIRYLLPLFPLLTLMAGYGLKAMFSDERARRFAVLCAISTAAAVALGGYLPFLNTTTMANLRDAGKYVDSLPGDSVEVRVLPQKVSSGNTEAAVPLLDVYTKKKLSYAARGLPRPEGAVLDTSPLRFTWETPLPAFYTIPAVAQAGALVVISGDRVNTLRDARFFRADSGTFRYRTLVAVFTHPAGRFSTATGRDWPFRDSDGRRPPAKPPVFLKK